MFDDEVLDLFEAITIAIPDDLSPFDHTEPNSVRIHLVNKRENMFCVLRCGRDTCGSYA